MKLEKIDTTKIDSFIDLVKSLNCPSHHQAMISFGRCEMQSGENHVLARCSECKAEINGQGHFVSKKLIPDSILSQLPVFVSYLDYDIPCEVCGSPGVELHHWGPKQFFPDNFEKWPKSYLCPTCHQEWHNKITIPLQQLKKKVENGK